MSFSSLNVDELKAVVQHFQVDVEVANEDHGPTKKELLAALAAGDDPVTWNDYKEFYVAAPEVPAEDDHLVVSEPEPVVKKSSERDNEEKLLVKFVGKNPLIEVVGHTFTAKHPFASVPSSVAEHLVRNVPGFRLAMPSEVTDYYN